MRYLRFSLGLALASLTVGLAACGGRNTTPAATSAAGPLSLGNSAGFPGHAPPHPPPQTVAITGAAIAAARAGGWQKVTAAAPFGAGGAGTPLLMTDGTIFIGDNGANWYSLTPDQSGSYVNGAWKKKASLPSGYAPLYFASAVLADDKVIINGGEYNFGHSAETNLGAIYDPVADAWTPVTPPGGWTQIGDAQSAVLADGTYMIGNCCTRDQALYNESAQTWTVVSAGKADTNSEEGWTLLPSGDLITADVGAEPNSEAFNPTSQSWSSAGSLPANLTQSFEIGPQTLRPNGTIFVVGANQNTAVYNVGTHAWSAGPALPIVGGKQLDSADGPASVLTNGNVIFALSPGVYKSPAYFYIYDGTKLTAIAGPPNAPNDSSYNLRLLLLPNGQILETDGSNDVEIYTPHALARQSLAPVIGSAPSTVTHGQTYSISGVHFNGYTQASTYGDDSQSATNYPLVQIVNTATGHVYYARTHGTSSMAIASPATVTTMFDVPATIAKGAAKLTVIANGIQSAAITVTVK